MGVAAKALLRSARRSHLRGLAKPVECRTGSGPRAHRCYRPALRPHTMSITRFNPPFRSQVPPQWRGACAAVAGGGPNRATAIVVVRLVFTISAQSRAFTALRLIDLVTAVHSHLNELAALEFGLQQLARLEDELAPDGALRGPLVLALSSRTRIGTVERANAIAAATLPAEAQRRLTVMPIEITTGYRRPDGQWPPRCPVAWLVHANASFGRYSPCRAPGGLRLTSHTDAGRPDHGSCCIHNRNWDQEKTDPAQSSFGLQNLGYHCTAEHVAHAVMLSLNGAATPR